MPVKFDGKKNIDLPNGDPMAEQYRAYACFLAALRAKIGEKKFTQKELAEAVGAHKTHINAIYRGRVEKRTGEPVRASQELQEEIARFYGYTLQEFIALGESLLSAESGGEDFFASNNDVPRRRAMDSADAVDALLSSVTNWVQQTRELAKERNFLRSVLDSIDDAVAIINLRLDVTFQNRSHLSLVGGAKIGKPCHEVHNCPAPEHCPGYKAMQTGIVSSCAISTIGKAKVDAVASPIRSNNGEVIGAVLTIRKRKKS